MSNFVLEAKAREDMGKGASRRLRREGLVPAVIYGDKKKAISLTMDHDKLMHAMENDAFYSSILELKIDGKKQKAIIKDLQRHPYKPKLVHADFLRVSDKVEIHVHVPVHIHGEEEAPGLKEGGVLARMLNEVEVACLPGDLPESINVDISGLEMDGVIHLSELTIPEGVKIVALTHGEEHDTGVVSIHMPKVEAEPEPEVEAEEGAEGEAAEGEQAEAAGEKAEGEADEKPADADQE